MPKRSSHVRKSNYRPKRVQPAASVKNEPAKSLQQTQPKRDPSQKKPGVPVPKKVSSAQQKTRTAHRNPSPQRKAAPQRKRTASSGKNPAPASLIFWAKTRRGALAIKTAVLLIVLCLTGTFAVHIIKDISEKNRQEAAEAAAIAAKEEKERQIEEAKTAEIDFKPHCVDSTKPENLIQYTEVQVDGNILENVSQYKPDSEISFDRGNKYTDMKGIAGFRGNNFRDSAAYGTVKFKENTLEEKWTKTTGSLSSGGTVWTGSGWTGQPLMQKWPKEVRAHMNMHDWAKEEDELVEVIYACMDGYVYFLDLATGKETRDALYLGYTFKGSGALDPRGYPILYVGAGYNSDQGTAKVFVVNLLDCSTMYTFGEADEFSLRGTLSFFDGSALIDAETDTLIYPGENGILYLIKLNTQYDPKAGTLSVNPGKTVKWHYYGTRSTSDTYWVGMEASAAMYKNYIFLAENGGNLMCLDVNTLELVWVQDILDDSNSTPVLSIEDGHLYLYVSTSFRLGWRSYDQATVPVWKIDAETGEIIWQADYECYTEDGVSGGVQSTIASGKNSLSDYVYVTVSKTDDNATGVLHCLDKKTGKMVWEHKAGYAWSSPVCVYDKKGKGRVLYCSSDGNMYLLDGKTGEVHDTLRLSDGVIEASPAVYGSTAVVGTRDCEIWGVKLQ